MSKRGRPRKIQSVYSVQNWIEYTSDSDSDNNNVQQNRSYEIEEGSLQSIGLPHQARQIPLPKRPRLQIYESGQSNEVPQMQQPDQQRQVRPLSPPVVGREGLPPQQSTPLSSSPPASEIGEYIEEQQQSPPRNGWRQQFPTPGPAVETEAVRSQSPRQNLNQQPVPVEQPNAQVNSKS